MSRNPWLRSMQPDTAKATQTIVTILMLLAVSAGGGSGTVSAGLQCHGRDMVRGR